MTPVFAVFVLFRVIINACVRSLQRCPHSSKKRKQLLNGDTLYFISSRFGFGFTVRELHLMCRSTGICCVDGHILLRYTFDTIMTRTRKIAFDLADCAFQISSFILILISTKKKSNLFYENNRTRIESDFKDPPVEFRIRNFKGIRVKLLLETLI